MVVIRVAILQLLGECLYLSNLSISLHHGMPVKTQDMVL